MRWLLQKDLRILRRSPVLVGTVVIYPIVIALLIGLAVSSPPGRPTVAIYSGVPSGQGTIALGSQHLSIARYEHELFDSIAPLRANSAAAAVADVRSGRALAALIIPADIDRQIQSLIANGTGNPTIKIVFNSHNPLERSLAKQAIQTRVDEVQSAISREVVRTVVVDLQKVLNGGHLGFLGASVHLLGLKGARSIVQNTVAALPHDSPLRGPLRQVVDFATVAIDGLTLASPDIGSIGTPLTVQESALSGRTTPTSSYAIAIAAVVLLMFVALLIGAGMVALERSENAYRRLVRGLVRPDALLAEKLLLAAGCAFVMTLATSAVVSAFVSLDWSRFALWIVALALGAGAFAALGVAIGVLARDVSVASLLAFLIALPVAFIALVPDTAVSSTMNSVLSVISFIFPFRPALDAVANAFTASSPAIGLPLLHLALLGLVFFGLARVALARR